MWCNLSIYLAPCEYYIVLTGPRCCCVVWASATMAAAWLRHRTDYCAFSFERREPHGIPSSCIWPQLYGVPIAHVATVVWCVLLFVEQLCHHFQTSPTFQLSATVSRQTVVAPLILRRAVGYRDDIVGRELNLEENCPVGSGNGTHNLPNSCDRWRSKLAPLPKWSRRPV